MEPRLAGRAGATALPAETAVDDSFPSLAAAAADAAAAGGPRGHAGAGRDFAAEGGVDDDSAFLAMAAAAVDAAEASYSQEGVPRVSEAGRAPGQAGTGRDFAAGGGVDEVTFLAMAAAAVDAAEASYFREGAPDAAGVERVPGRAGAGRDFAAEGGADNDVMFFDIAAPAVDAAEASYSQDWAPDAAEGGSAPEHTGAERDITAEGEVDTESSFLAKAVAAVDAAEASYSQQSAPVAAEAGRAPGHAGTEHGFATEGGVEDEVTFLAMAAAAVDAAEASYSQESAPNGGVKAEPSPEHAGAGHGSTAEGSVDSDVMFFDIAAAAVDAAEASYSQEGVPSFSWPSLPNPTPEQIEILQQVKAPLNVDPAGAVYRINSGPGTGKTTTIRMIAQRACDLGHRRVVYLTFSRRMAETVRRREAKHLVDAHGLAVKTAHACALHAVQGMKELRGFRLKLVAFKEEETLRTLCGDLFESLVSRVYWKRKAEAVNRCATFASSFMTSFLESSASLEDLRDRTFEFPSEAAQSWHNKGNMPGVLAWGKARPIYEEIVNTAVASFVEFYKYPSHLRSSNGGRKNWETTHGSYVKIAQLKGLPINASLLLVDEAQDLSTCQLEWLAAQAHQGIQVFFLGDTAQAIYGFRGAVPTSLLTLGTHGEYPVEDYSLTKSFRFGTTIAAVANSLLFVKEHSPQAGRFHPYRIQGAASDEGEVVTGSLLKRGHKKVCILCRTNGGVVDKGLASVAVGKSVALIIGDLDANEKMLGILRDVAHFYDVYSGQARILPAKFTAFRGEVDLTWDKVKTSVRESHMKGYLTYITIVERFQKETLTVLHNFKSQVLESGMSADDADVVLGTVHGAKGLEFDHVELGNDFLGHFGEYEAKLQWTADDVRLNSGHHKCEYCLKDSEGENDEVNCIFVAATRARLTLSLPPRVYKIFTDLHKAKSLNDLSQSTFNDDDTSPKSSPSKSLFIRDLLEPWQLEMDQQGVHPHFLDLFTNLE